jgi:peptidyl-prolyl cis-trans isomerase C
MFPMRLRHALPVVALLAFSAPAFADEYVIMKINNQDVSSSEVQRMLDGVYPAGQAPVFDTLKPDMQERVLRALMAEKVIYGEAVKAGVDKSDKVQKKIEDVKKKIVVQTYLDTKTSDTISDADVKKEYDKMNDAMKDEKEVHARHILLATEQEAKDAKKKLDAGKSFEDVAKDYSKDAGSAKNGGDLGWFTKDKMVPEFAAAAFSMKKGEISGPVKSSFGWHIIQVEDIRKVAPPAFAEVKEQIKAKLQEKKLNDYIASLVKGADVKVFDAKGKEVPFNKNLPDEKGAAPAKAN